MMSRARGIRLVLAVAVLLGPLATACTGRETAAPPAPAPATATAAPAPPARGDRPGCTPVNISASSEKAALLGQIADGYNLAARTVGGRCVDVRVATLASGTAVTALAATASAADWDEATNGLRPDVWSPASSLWGGILEQRLRDAGRPSLVPADRPSIAQTPLVIAMPRPMAEALGWPDREIGWEDLARLADDPAGWGLHGHPEWGAFKLGKTNPTISTSGMSATVATFHAKTDLSTDLTPADIANPEFRDFVSSIESSAVHYADTTLTFLQNLYDAADRGRPLGYVSAVAVEEKSVWDYNQGNPSGNPKTLGQQPPPKVQLVAVYPKEGTLVSDNPFVVLTADWVDEARRAAAADFLEYVRRPEQQQRFQGAAFRSFEGVAGAPISRENGMLPDQRLEVFRPPRDVVLNEIVEAWSELRKKANLIFVLDVSGSMAIPAAGDAGPTRLDLAKSAVKKSLTLLDDDDVVSIWEFSSERAGSAEPYRVLAPPAPLGATRASTEQLIDGLTPSGATALYATTRRAVEQLRADFQPRRINAVVLLTDGLNEYKPDDDIDRLEADLRTDDDRSLIRVFPIAYGPDAENPGTTQPLPLDRIADATTTRKAYRATTDPKSIDKALRDVVSNF